MPAHYSVHGFTSCLLFQLLKISLIFKMKPFVTLAITVGLAIALPAPTNKLVCTFSLIIITRVDNALGDVNHTRHYTNKFIVPPQSEGANYIDTSAKRSVSIPFHDNRKLHYSGGIPIAE